MRERLAQSSASLPTGRVQSVVGLAVRATLPGARVGDLVSIRRPGAALAAEVVGVDGGSALLMPLGEVRGVGADDVVETRGQPLAVRVSSGMLGRVINALGEPLDGGEPLREGPECQVDAMPPPALKRQAITDVLATGVRVIDGLLTVGQGQRVGLFAGSGVGKSTLLGAIARGAAADVVVVALVGERGREVGDFVRDSLGRQGLRKSVVVVATADEPAMLRLRAAQVATTIAESFRDAGKRVLLLVDSVTRFARAQREVGLAAGEPPARRGYPPSVFAMLPRLLERTGQGACGSITAVYTVLVEGSDMDEPIADEVRGMLDGHIVLDRGVAGRGRYPAVDVLQSISRVMPAIVSAEHLKAAQRVRQMLAVYEAKRDLIGLGAYAKGTDAQLDAAVKLMPKLDAFLSQDPQETGNFEHTVERLAQLGRAQ